MSDPLPLENLISRLRADLKLSKNSCVVKTLDGKASQSTQNKNRRKASILYYLEELKRLKDCK